MSPKLRTDTPLYLAWCPDFQGQEDGAEWGAINIAFAARLQATYFHDHLGGHDCQWPVTVLVIDPDGKRFAVVVHRNMKPVFESGEPMEVK